MATLFIFSDNFEEWDLSLVRNLTRPKCRVQKAGDVIPFSLRRVPGNQPAHAPVTQIKLNCFKEKKVIPHIHSF